MKKLLSCFFVSIFLIGCEDSPKLIWEEEFEGETLNEEIWNFELGDGCPNLCGWGNNEAQIYTDSNHTVKDGMLTITTKFEDSTYTSTRITTKNKFEFQYGTIEVRAKLPLGKGLWPAFWMLGSNINEVGWPLCGEIDIVEYVGKEPEMIFTSLHTASSSGNPVNTRKATVEGIEEGFHTYKATWTAEAISFYVDDVLFYTYEPEPKNEEVWPFDQPFYIIANVAIGGNFGGPEIDNSIFPQEFVLDYIRVYQ